MEWTQRSGIGPGAEILGADLVGRLIVELGCGPGHNTAHLAGLGVRATGIDSSLGQIHRARAHYAHTGARFVRSTASAYLNREPGQLDAIVSVFGAVGPTEPSQLLRSCSRRLTREGLLAFSVPHPQRTGTVPAHPRTRTQVSLPDGSPLVVQHWDIAPTSWVRALNRAGLLVTGVHDLFAPTDACRPTTLLITARKP